MKGEGGEPKEGKHKGLPLQNTGAFSNNRNSKKNLLESQKIWTHIPPFKILKRDYFIKTQ
ncbi:hypothetical protein THC_1333 [Caldimicrobium thiodismutans]|uniref:Uncharacterized protein n=1 Tax=Caldimicrobium thiodismutans TaxID=1653476 RepID=A0A0U5BY50_9BACT|nr:hypothetical protein THC_1333 [Caldimicrobium thiodismutans]